MTKIAPLSLPKLRQDELFAFFTDTRRFIQNHFDRVPEWAENYMKASSDFNDALMAQEEGPSAADLEAADKAADEAWVGFSGYLRAMSRHPNAEIRAAVEACSVVLFRFEKPTAKGYAVEYAYLDQLCGALKTIPAETRVKAGAEEWILPLVERCQVFIDLYTKRVQSMGQRQIGINAATRSEATKAYRKMIEHANALMIVASTPELEGFAASMNQLIDRRQVVLKSRKTAAQNQAESDSEENPSDADRESGL